jgi:hypothetical protein
VNFSAEPLAGTVVTSRQRGILTSADFEQPVLR